MNSNGSRIAAAVVAIALVVVLFVFFKGGDDDSSATTTTTPAITQATTGGTPEKAETEPTKPKPPTEPTIVIEGGQPVGGVADLTFNKGENVQFLVDSDTADEVHVHGYDVSAEVAPGEKARFDFPAELDGVYEVELENSAVPIAELTVNP